MNNKNIWIAADYKFPYTYSIKSPLSSREIASCLPAPGPATIRLAFIRASIEFFGFSVTREELFPVIRNVEIKVRPPEAVAITYQLLTQGKYSKGKRNGSTMSETIINREYAHSKGTLSIFINTPKNMAKTMFNTLNNIGYWGEKTSFTQCTATYYCDNEPNNCAVSLESKSIHDLKPSFVTYVTEFNNSEIRWEEIVPDNDNPTKENFLKIIPYAWPMKVNIRSPSGILLLRNNS